MLKRGPRYSPAELNVRLRFVVGIALAAILSVCVIAMLYGLLFVYSGDDLSGLDAEFFKLLNPVVMFLTGTLSGVMIASGSRTDRDGDGIPDDQEVNNGPAQAEPSEDQPRGDL